jgi:rare lipoprotein A
MVVARHALLLAVMACGLFWMASEDASAQSLQEVSCYGAELAGSPTASGEPFDPSAFTAASPWLPFGTVVGVHAEDTGGYVEVTINDRGPYVGGRTLDLSCGAMQALGLPIGVYPLWVTVF